MSRSPLRKLRAETGDIVHDASKELTHDVGHASQHLQHALHRTGRVLAKTGRAVATDAREEADDQLRRVAQLMRANPRAALSIAFCTGLVISAALVQGRRRQAA